jgi:hypothetical protein
VPWFCCVAACEVLRAKRQFASRISLIGPTMARAYQGIDLLDAFESGDFLVWKQMTLAYFARDFLLRTTCCWSRSGKHRQ